VYVIVRPMSGSGLTDYDEFFAETRPGLVGIGLALTGDLQIAQELAQEALIRAWVHWRRIRNYDQPAAWARRVVRNLAADRAKHLRRTPVTPPVEHVPAPTPDRLALISALAMLPRQQREALVLHDGIGLSVAEVAIELGVPEGTVRSWLSRSRAMLAPILGVGDNATEVRCHERS
jgi:RNA polymerase sigma-70 factor, ECF subfamily